MVFQMMYQRKVSRKNRMRSIMNIIVNVNVGWFKHNVSPNNQSSQFKTLVPTIMHIGSQNDNIRKKYNSTNLQLNTSTQSKIEAMCVF